MSDNTFKPGPTPNTIRAADGRVLTAPAGWVLLPPGDAALTRRVKAAGEHWIVQEKKARKVFSRGVWAPAATIERIEGELGWTVMQLYGLTETSPAITVCEPRLEHQSHSARGQAAIKARQGVELITSGEVRVVDAEGNEVANDGQSQGEIVVRGNVVIPDISTGEPLKSECQAFLDAVIKNVPPHSDGQMGADVVRVLEAMDQSMAQNSLRVSLSSVSE